MWPTGLYNDIGTGKARTWNRSIKAVFAVIDNRPNIEYISRAKSICSQYDYFAQGNVTKLGRGDYKKKQGPRKMPAETMSKTICKKKDF